MPQDRPIAPRRPFSAGAFAREPGVSLTPRFSGVGDEAKRSNNRFSGFLFMRKPLKRLAVPFAPNAPR
jgi:hypothetical protein